MRLNVRRLRHVPSSIAQYMTSRLAHLLRSSLRYDLPAALAALGPQVDHPIGAADHVQIVLDDQDAAAVLDQPLESAQQLRDVVEVQPGGRLVEDEQRAVAARLAQVAASFTRCASPPLSVVADWPSRR